MELVRFYCHNTSVRRFLKGIFNPLRCRYITFVVDLGKLSVLRTFRVFRALKTVAVVPGKSSNLTDVCILFLRRFKDDR